VYKLKSIGGEGWDSLPVNETGTSVSLISFDGVTILPRFARVRGMENADVLLEAEVKAPSTIEGVYNRYVQREL
jgi:UDP-glucose:glycoprotein glucosyltransferase